MFAGPAIWTIDTFGRRNLLLVSFPLMALMLLMTGFALYVMCSGVSAAVLLADVDQAGYPSPVRPMSGPSLSGYTSSRLRTRLERAPFHSQ